MFDFLNKKWIQILAWIFYILSTLVLLLSGTAVGDIVKVPAMIVGIVDAVVLLISFIKKLLQKKASANK